MIIILFKSLFYNLQKYDFISYACTYLYKKRIFFEKYSIGMPVSGRCGRLHFGEIGEILHRLDGAICHLQTTGRCTIAEEQKFGL